MRRPWDKNKNIFKKSLNILKEEDGLIISGPWARIFMIIMFVAAIICFVVGYTTAGVWIIFWLIVSIIWSLISYGIEKRREAKYTKEVIDKTVNGTEDSSKDLEKSSENNNIYCPYCGTELPSDAKFCKSCGKKI